MSGILELDWVILDTLINRALCLLLIWDTTTTKIYLRNPDLSTIFLGKSQTNQYLTYLCIYNNCSVHIHPKFL
jgi:hypothetical protein